MGKRRLLFHSGSLTRLTFNSAIEICVYVH